MKQQQKLKICVKALGFSENHINDFRNRLEILICTPAAINELVTTLHIATWYNSQTKEWWAFPSKYWLEFFDYISDDFLGHGDHFYQDKEHSQAVLDCVAQEN